MIKRVWIEQNEGKAFNPTRDSADVLVETDDGLSVDDGYRRALKALIEQLFERGLIGANIFFHELDALLR